MKQNPNENAYDFSIYRLSVSQPGIRIFTTAVAVFNALLLIPDILHLTGRALIAVCVLRSFYSILCVIFAFNLRHFRSFKALSFAVTLAEMMAAGIFLVVFSLYRTPDLLIQILGIMLLILIVFMVPNRFSCMIALSLATALGFLAIAYNLFANADRAQYIAAAIYMAADIAFGAIFALINLKYQRREYASFAELQKLYATDPLTQVGNRIRLEKEAEKWLAFCSRHNLPLSLVIIDIDNMKKINDQHGHLAGDATICELVQTMCPQLRRNDVCVRWGGDEFVLLLPGTDAAAAQRLVERIRREVENHVFPADSRVTCSFGIADTSSGSTLHSLFSSADQSLYQAKKRGKNAACLSVTPQET